jgi:lipoyl(octanoyl) transferase
LPSQPICQVTHLGTVDYLRAWEIQLSIADQVRRGERPNTLLLLEHPPVYTMGRLSKPEHLLVGKTKLEARGISVYETDRGGQVTFHGPGQLVAYPVVDLREWGGPVKYVRTLEQVIINTLHDLEIQAHLVEGLTGVWGGKSPNEAKIAAIGVKISRGVAFHGLAINMNTNLSYYENIVPCGIEDRPVTSIAQVLGGAVDEEAVRYSLVYQFGRGMGFSMSEVDAASVTGILAVKG